MSRGSKCWLASIVMVLFWTATIQGQERSVPIPDSLKQWQDWVLWNEPAPNSPSAYDQASQKIAVWASSLEMVATTNQGAEWRLQVRVFDDAWMSLPGDADHWPQSVQVDNQVVAVVEREGRPAIEITRGLHTIAGRFLWVELPESIILPDAIGIVRLSIDNEEIAIPAWDSSGALWLKRKQSGVEEEDFLSLKIHRVIEDGLPIWLRTELEISVSGKSREEDLGFVLPEGWQLSFVDSPIPAALDENGRAKVQVRAGTWRIRIDAFRTEDLTTIQYGSDRPPAVESELIGLRARPLLRVTELQGATPEDANMTTFPSQWRDLPVFRWSTDQTLKWVVKSMGAGELQPNRYDISRQLWLDDSGKGFTYQDNIGGQSQSIARLDAAEGHALAVVRNSGERQLITRNPNSNAEGIELRSRSPKIEAIGRVANATSIVATGWDADAESLRLTLQLPPGWRMLALFGADRVEGDWLTAWTLLDLFLLLIFSLAVARMWGIGAGAIAFFAFGLAYHELGAPRYTWLFLLMPVALLSVVREGILIGWLRAWHYLALGLLTLFLAPFAAHEVQNALYPQLEPAGIHYLARDLFNYPVRSYPPTRSQSFAEYDRAMVDFRDAMPTPNMGKQLADPQLSNLAYDPGTSIQTGIAKPEWRANEVQCIWDGPVSSRQTIRPIMLSSLQHRLLIGVRLILLGMLVAMFFRDPHKLAKRKRETKANLPAKSVGMTLVLCSLFAIPARAQEFPDPEILETLRSRLSQPSAAFPHAADIASADLKVEGSRLMLQAEVHAATACAIPVPGQLPVWSPLTVRIDDSAADVCRRKDGHLWVLVPKGVHQLSIEGLLGDASEWVWAMDLQPKILHVDAPDWNVTGLRADGRPEKQLFFSRKVRVAEAGTNYSQKNFQPVVQVDRALELGLVWKMRTTVKRLSNAGRAISTLVPLTPGERIVSGGVKPGNGAVEVNLAAGESEVSWESILPQVAALRLEAKALSQVVERWSVVTSPVWNVQEAGLPSIYEEGKSELVRVWYPWPGESVALSVARPEAIPGKTLTVQHVEWNMALGNRQRVSDLNVSIESSMGGEFAISLPNEVVVDRIMVGGETLPVRRDGNQYIVGLQPGPQFVSFRWLSNEPMKVMDHFPAVTLPVEAANVNFELNVPASRWILWAAGPVRGPAVRWWVILVFACIIALALSRFQISPLKGYEWVLLAIGLTQIHYIASLVIVLWLFLLAIRGRRDPESVHWFVFDLWQLLLIVLTFVSLGILVFVVSRGLLGNPQMFIAGNDSYGTLLRWYEPNAGAATNQPWIISISIWYYRLLMLVWALWLANAVIGWLKQGWSSFTHGGGWRRRPRVKTQPDAVA